MVLIIQEKRFPHMKHISNKYGISDKVAFKSVDYSESLIDTIAMIADYTTVIDVNIRIPFHTIEIIVNHAEKIPAHVYAYNRAEVRGRQYIIKITGRA